MERDLKKDLQWFYEQWRKKEAKEREQEMNYTARHYGEILDDMRERFDLVDQGD